jgi:hypothetical protein
VGPDLYGVVVVMCLLTTLVGPPLLVGLYPKEKPAGAVDNG